MSCVRPRLIEAEYPCPACGQESRQAILNLRGGELRYTGCLSCGACWESIPDGATFTVDGELMPWSEPCDNCAFRPGSPETADRVQWKKLLERLRRGGQFFCHKGVPLEIEEGTHKVAGFDYPKREDGSEDPHQMRLCRGFLNAWIKWERRERLSFTCTAADLEEEDLDELRLG